MAVASGVLYYYTEDGSFYEEPSFTETIDENGDTVYEDTTTIVYNKIILTEEEAYEHINAMDHVPIYAVYENGLVAQIAEIEEVVGEETPTAAPEPRTTSSNEKPILTTTTQTITIESVSAGSTFAQTVTPTLSGYTLIGVLGYSFSGTSYLTLYRLLVENGSLKVGVRNNASSAISDKTLTVTLLWSTTGTCGTA